MSSNNSGRYRYLVFGYKDWPDTISEEYLTVQDAIEDAKMWQKAHRIEIVKIL